MRATAELQELGQSLWLDTITREMLDSGQLQRYVEEFSITGLTSNPSIFEKAIKSGAYDDDIRLILTCVATSLIDSFTVGRGGLISAARGSPFAAEGLHAFDSEFRPTDAAQLDVTNAQDGANAGTVSALAVNTASRSISSYSIATGSSLTLLRSTSVIAAATPDDARLSPGWHHPLGRRLHGRRRQWFCRQRWWTHRTADFADARSDRGRAHRHRRHERRRRPLRRGRRRGPGNLTVVQAGSNLHDLRVMRRDLLGGLIHEYDIAAAA